MISSALPIASMIMISLAGHGRVMPWASDDIGTKYRSYVKPTGYTKVEYYSVGSRIRVKLYPGEKVEAEVTAIMDQSSGPNVQIRFGGVTILISPEQIIEVVP